MSIDETVPFKGAENLTTTIEGFEENLTICDCFEAACKKFEKKTLYRFRKVVKQHIELTLATNNKFITYEHGLGQRLTYGEFFDMSKALSSGILRYDTSLKPQSRVGIYLSTSLEWSLALQGLLGAGLTVTTVYATLGWESLIESLNEAELSCIVCAADNVANMDRFLGGGGKCPKLKKLICVGDIHFKSQFFETKSIYEIMKDGYESPQKLTPPKPDDLAILMYTSGTTGTPKGVMMKHRNVVAAASGFTRRLKFDENDVHLSYLPFAHIFEMAVHISVLFKGGEIVFANPRTLFAKPGGAKNLGDIAFAKPTIFCGVPKVWETLRKGVASKVRMGTPMEQFMFNMVMMRKMDLLKKGKNEKVLFEAAGGLPLEDVVFKTVRGMLGGNLRVVVSGGAPLNPETQYFLQACVGPDVSVIQGYGLTETCAGATVQFLKKKENYQVSNIGHALSCVELKLVSVPEMNYSVKDTPPTGELHIRGPHITCGYFKKEGLTKASYDEDGWFHTGDIVQKNEDDSISIIDRKKNLVKLSHGEYVAVEAVEVQYGLSNFVAPNGIFVHVDPLKDFCVGVIVPDPIFTKQFAAKMKLGMTDVGEIITQPIYLDAIEKSLLEIAGTENMKKWEVLDKNRFVVRNELWLPTNGLLTAASKLKRRALREKYAKELDHMYGIKEEESEGEKEEEKSETSKPLPEYFALIRPNFV